MPDTEKDHARQWLTRQVLSAKTLPEVAAAETALREWIGCYPEEREWMRDGFEQLSMMRDIAEEEAGQMLENDEEEREHDAGRTRGHYAHRI